MSAEALQLLAIIKRLSLSEKLEIMELIAKNIKEENMLAEDKATQRKAAAELLLKDYQQDEELVAFTAIDHEAFMKRTEIWLINSHYAVFNHRVSQSARRVSQSFLVLRSLPPAVASVRALMKFDFFVPAAVQCAL